MNDIVERLQNTPNWTREESGAWGFTTHVCDRAPFEAADEIEKLRAALQTAQRDALEEAAKWHDEQAKRWQNTYVKESLSGLDMQAARVMCLEHGGFHIESAAAIRALGEKG